MTRETEVIDKARTWRRAQRTRIAASPEKKQAARDAEYHALRKLENAVDALEKEKSDAPP